MKTASRKIRVAAIALCTVFALCSFALAVGAVDTSRNCSLSVKLGATAAGKENMQITANLYKVAEFTGDTYTYTAAEPFATEMSSYDLSNYRDWVSVDTKVGAAANAAATVVQEKAVAATNTTPVTFQGDSTGGKFENIPCGLYLLLTTAVDTTAAYNYTFTPVLLSLPSMNTDGSDNYSIAGLELKFERETAKTSIQIKKDLNRFSTLQGPATFIFKVEAVKGEATVYSNVFSMVFTAAGSQTITVENLPIGSNVTVTEVYGGGSYAVTGDAAVTIENLTKPAENEQPATAAFVNDYTGKTPTSHSVTNKYTFTDGGWGVAQVKEAE